MYRDKVYCKQKLILEFDSIQQKIKKVSNRLFEME